MPSTDTRERIISDAMEAGAAASWRCESQPDVAPFVARINALRSPVERGEGEPYGWVIRQLLDAEPVNAFFTDDRERVERIRARQPITNRDGFVTEIVPVYAGKLAGEADWMWRELGAARDMLSDNYWLWQGDGEDHLESLICPVVIRPEVLAQLIASPPAPIRCAALYNDGNCGCVGPCRERDASPPAPVEEPDAAGLYHSSAHQSAGRGRPARTPRNLAAPPAPVERGEGEPFVEWGPHECEHFREPGGQGCGCRHCRAYGAWQLLRGYDSSLLASPPVPVECGEGMRLSCPTFGKSWAYQTCDCEVCKPGPRHEPRRHRAVPIKFPRVPLEPRATCGDEDCDNGILRTFDPATDGKPCPDCARLNAPVPVEGERERFQMASRFASRAHQGQRYTGYAGRPDEPYVLHPLRVADAVQPRCRVVAVLHDCMEDAGTLPDWLTETERAALDLLTRRKDRDEYAAYIARIRGDRTEAGEIAREVKVADLRDNLSHDPPDRLRVRYEAALAMLTAPVEGERISAIYRHCARCGLSWMGEPRECPACSATDHGQIIATVESRDEARAAITRLYLAAHRAGVEAAAEVLSGTTKGWRTLVAARDTLAEDARADTEDEYNWTDPRSPLARALAALPVQVAPGDREQWRIQTLVELLEEELLDPCDHPRRSHEEVGCIYPALRACLDALRGLAALPVQGEREARDAVIRFAEEWAEKWERIAAGHSTDGEGSIGWRDCFRYCAENLRSNVVTLREERETSQLLKHGEGTCDYAHNCNSSAPAPAPPPDGGGS